ALENIGIASWRDGVVRGEDGAAVINRLGATFKIGDRCFCGAGRFVNAGAFDKIAGLGAARFESSFENTGSVLVQSGRLELAGGGSTTGPFISNLGSSIAITNGYAFRSNSTVGGPGLPMQVSGGAVDVDANVSIKNLDVTGAAMLVHGSLNAENIEVSAGKLAIEGTVDVARIDLTGGSLEGGVHIPFTAQTGLLSVSQRLNWVGGA